jgi:hypothetical protein
MWEEVYRGEKEVGKGGRSSTARTDSIGGGESRDEEDRRKKEVLRKTGKKRVGRNEIGGRMLKKREQNEYGKRGKLRLRQCSGSMTFWYGSGLRSSDPCL